MLLTLFKFTMIVPLLISVEANSKELIPTEEKKSIVAHRDVKQIQDENSNFLEKRQLKNERSSNERDLNMQHIINPIESRFVRSNGKGLAHKMAKDALKSPKMQETMRKLSKVSKSKSASASMKTSKNRLRMANDKRHQKGGRHKGGRKRKRKRHHRRHEKDHSRLKGGSSKGTSNRKRDINSSLKRSNCDEDDISLDESSSSRSNDKVTVVKVDDRDYIDFSTPLMTQSSLLNIQPRYTDDTNVELQENEKMIDRLMRTTTKDPSKKNPSDPGIEYSDYYSEDEVLQDLAANKIPVQLRSNSNDRVARQTLNLTSRRDRNRRRIDRRPRDRRKLRKTLERNNFHNYQRYPLSRRNVVLDDSSSDYPPNFESLDHQEDVNLPYFENTNEILEQSQKIEDKTDSNALDFPRSNIPVYPERYNYINQYSNPEEVFVPSSELQTFNEASQVPPIGDVNNYQREGNVDEAENLRISSVKPEELETQPSYSPLRLYDTQEDSIGLPNAMEQPLGKILETLGINVNGATSNFDARQGSYSNTLDRPMERALSPSYLRKGPNDDLRNYREDNRVKEVDSRNKKNEREGHSRRHLIDDSEFDKSIVEEERPTHNMNISIAVHDTKEVANQILDTIMEELEELKTDRSKNDKREGSWSTAQAGVKLDMRVVNRTIIVTLSDLTSPHYHESLLNGTWNVSGHAPFKRGSPFTLIATDKTSNSLAVFVGACRVCQGIDTIAGIWSVARQPKSCNDFQVSTSVFNDIFRKTKLSSLRENQGTNKTENATLNHKKRKS